MKTADLIDALARDAGPVPRAAAVRRLAPAGLAAVACSLAIVVAVAGRVPWDIQPLASLALKFTYTGALAAAAVWLAAKLSRPAAHPAVAAVVVAFVVIAMIAVGLSSLVDLSAPDRMTALLGHSWLICPWAVAALSIPGLVIALLAMRGLAPTRPRAAGAAAGLVAGAGGAFGYALGCIEQAPAFVAIWYTLGILIAAAIGALLGPRLLRW